MLIKFENNLYIIVIKNLNIVCKHKETELKSEHSLAIRLFKLNNLVKILKY
jgi:hypothetical protein